MSKILFLVPPSMNVETIVKSLHGHDSHVWHLGSEKITTDLVKEFAPEIVIYTGATEGIYCVPIDRLKKLREYSKTVFISCAASDPNWHPLLKKYADEDVFDLVVNIDGYDECWPKRSQDFTWIGCVDPTPYLNQIPKKEHDIGVCAGSHPARDIFVSQLDMVTRFVRNEKWGDHQRYVDFMLQRQMFLNVNWADPYEPVLGVNMKCLEAGLAKTLLLEKKGGLLNRWFTPNIDYLEYDTVDDVREIWANRGFKAEVYAKIVENMLFAIKTKYSNKLFWEKVLGTL